ncbi:outer membrane receptor for monomeric catechols [Bradyrhizobium sp. LB7.1]
MPYYRPSTASTAGGPFPDFGANRNNWYGQINRDFYRTGQDIGSLNAEVQITPDLMVSNRFRASRSTQNYVGTLPESPINATPLSASTLTMNPQSRLQITDVIANQTEATYKFQDGAGFKHTALAGIEVDRERSSIDKYLGLTSEGNGVPVSPSGSPTGVSVFFPQDTFLPGKALALAGLPTKIGIDTVSGYVMDSANYRDLLILNGGFRYDNYQINTSGYGTVGGVSQFGQQSAEFLIPNFNLGLTLKPLPNGSVYVAYATSANPVGAEFDGTSTAYGGSHTRPQRQYEPDFRAGEEQGDRARHEMGVVRPSPFADGGAVSDHEGQRARIAEHYRGNGNGDLSLSSNCTGDYRLGVLYHGRRSLPHPRH